MLSTCLFHDRSELAVTEVLGIFDSLEFSVMDAVLVGEWIPFVGDPYDLTFVRIKLHESVPFPLL